MNKKPDLVGDDFTSGESTKYVLLSEYKSTRNRLGQTLAILFISIVLNIFLFAVVIPDQYETIVDQERVISNYRMTVEFCSIKLREYNK